MTATTPERAEGPHDFDDEGTAALFLFATINCQNRNYDDVEDLLRFSAVWLGAQLRCRRSGGTATTRALQDEQQTAMFSLPHPEVLRDPGLRRWRYTGGGQPRFTTSHVYHNFRRLRHGSEGREVPVCLFSMHMPSIIGHTIDEIDAVSLRLKDLMLGNRFMTLFGGDLREELTDPMNNDSDNHVGAAFGHERHTSATNIATSENAGNHPEHDRPGRDFDLIHNMYRAWWKKVCTDNYEMNERE